MTELWTPEEFANALDVVCEEHRTRCGDILELCHNVNRQGTRIYEYKCSCCGFEFRFTLPFNHTTRKSVYRSVTINSAHAVPTSVKESIT